MSEYPRFLPDWERGVNEMLDRKPRMRTDNARFNYEPDYAVPPGRTLRELIDHAFCQKTGISEGVLSGILSGHQPITESLAETLEEHTRVPARMWLNLERRYRAQLAMLGERE